MATTSAQIEQLYVAYLGRAADKAGLDYWSTQLNAAQPTLTLDDLRANFVNEQPEYTAIYGGLDRSAQVTKIYENLFNRAPDAAGLAYWTTGDGSSVAANDLLIAFINGAAATDATTVSNKVFVAQTYTDTAGDSYNATAGAQVISSVTNDPSTVSAAVDTITNGTLPGGIPALNLIQAYETATAAVTAYGTTVAGTNAALDTNTDGSVSFAEANTALSSALTARDNVSTSTTVTLTANVTNATNSLNSVKTVLSATTGGTSAAAAYDSALATDTAAHTAVTANAAATSAAEAGVDTSVTAATSTVTYGTLSTAAGVSSSTSTTGFSSAADVLTFLTSTTSDATARANLVTELNKVPTFGAELVKAGDLGLASAKADAALSTATTTLTNLGTVGQDYINAETSLTNANTILANAQTADAQVAAVKTIVDQYAALNKTVADAQTAITTFETANSTKVDIHALATGAVSQTGDDTKSDVFFFTSKLTTTNDGTIGHFGTGDSIVLGSSLTYNSGALSAGDNNKAEFFLVQKGSDTLVVLETANYGSSTTLHTATSDTAAVTSPDAAVITLTGVNVADLTVSNGVISHVA